MGFIIKRVQEKGSISVLKRDRTGQGSTVVVAGPGGKAVPGRGDRENSVAGQVSDH
jgi:hypothetical protein